MSLFSASEAEQIRSVVSDFPVILDRAIEDWAKYKVAVKVGVFTPRVPYVLPPELIDQQDQILDWFSEFPRLWETIRPNFVMTPEGTSLSRVSPIVGKADNFVARLKSETVDSGLGAVPIIIIAGVLIAGLLGVAGAIWAIGYVKKQANISGIIDEVVAGRVSEDVLRQAIEQEQSGGMFAGLGNFAKWVAIAIGAALVLPLVFKK